MKTNITENRAATEKKKWNTKIKICVIAFIINMALFLTKLYVALSSNSISVFIDSLNSLGDSIISAIAVLGFYMAAKGPSKEYPFGHGKTEDLINLMLSTVIVITGAYFLYTSLQRLLFPIPVTFSVRYAVMIGITVLVKVFMIFFFRYEKKKLESPVMANFYLDSVLDFFISLCVLITFAVSAYVRYSVDAFTGIIVSAVILVSGIRALAEVASTIAGKRNDDLCEEAEELIKENGKVSEVRNIQCHSYGKVNVFTAEIVAKDVKTAEDVVSLTEEIEQSVNDSLDSAISVTICGINS